MKWFERAMALIPILGFLYPPARPLVPLILAGVTEAQAIHGADNNEVKKAHVLNLVAVGAAAATATGKVAIDPTQATTITQSVFAAIDAVHAIVKAQPAAAGA